jgi:hypothetical protein
MYSAAPLQDPLACAVPVIPQHLRCWSRLACVESSDTISEAALTAVRHLRPTKEMERSQGKIAHMHRTITQRWERRCCCRCLFPRLTARLIMSAADMRSSSMKRIPSVANPSCLIPLPPEIQARAMCKSHPQTPCQIHCYINILLYSGQPRAAPTDASE